MVDEIENRAPTRLLTKRLVLLWAFTCTGRILYMLEPFSNVALRPFLELAFLVFLLTISAVEIRILRMAAEDYKNSIRPLRPVEFPETVKLSAIYPLSQKLMMGIFMFCLVLVLWDTRNDNQMILPMAIGVAMNLWWVWRFATRWLRLNRPANR